MRSYAETMVEVISMILLVVDEQNNYLLYYNCLREPTSGAETAKHYE